MSATSVKPAEKQAIVTTDLTKWFGEGETKVTAVNGVALVANFGEMLFIVGGRCSRGGSAFATAVRHTRLHHATLYRLGMLEKGYRMQLRTIAHPLP